MASRDACVYGESAYYPAVATTDVARVVRQAAAKFRSFGLSTEDLQQEGHRAALEALAHFDAERGTPLGAYLYKAIKRQLGNYVSQEISVVSLHGNWKVGRESQTRIDIAPEADEGTATVLPVFVDRTTPERLLARKERMLRRQRWRMRFYRRLDALLAPLSEEERAIIRLRFGLEGTGEGIPDREVAATLGVPVRQVYRVLARFKHRARDQHTLFRLYREIEEIDRT